MTSLGEKRHQEKDAVDLSAKLTAANSNSTRMSRGVPPQNHHTSARNKTAQSVFYMDRGGRQTDRDLSERQLAAKTRSVDTGRHSPGEGRRTSHNARVAPSAAVEGDLNSLSRHRGGKRHTNVHGEPKSTTYQAQLEYLDKLASQYKELIHTEEQMRAAGDALDK